jgi:hypothetical protein
MQPGDALTQKIHHRAGKTTHHGAKKDLRRFGIAQIALKRHEGDARAAEPVFQPDRLNRKRHANPQARLPHCAFY